MVFQNYALYPHMSVYRNMAYGLKIRGLAKVGDRASGCSRRPRSWSSPTTCSQRKPRQLSGGQRQRVAMGRAIVREPSAFLFDEPLSNLDAKLRVQMRIEIKRLQAELGITSRLRDPRPGRGHDPGPPPLGAECRRGRAARQRPWSSMSRPASNLRRRLHRFPRDEPDAGQGRRRRLPHRPARRRPVFLARSRPRQT